MSNVLSKPKPQHSGGRNGYDLSFHRTFTSPCGMLLPVAKDFAYSGEKYRLNSQLMIRTQPLQTAAFMRLKAHVDWFFVPIQHIFKLWNEFYNQTQDIHSSIFFDYKKPRNPINFPLHSVQKYINDAKEFTDTVTSGSTYARQTDDFGVPLAYNFRRLWDLLGYGSVSNKWPNSVNLKLLLIDFLVYHRIFYSHYNPTDWKQNDPRYYNVDKYYDTGVVPDDITKMIISTIHYRPWRNDYFTHIFPQPVFSSAFANSLNTGLINASENLRPLVNREGITSSTMSTLYVSSFENGEIGDYGRGSAGVSLSIGGTHDDSILNIGDLRSMYALDKLLRTTALAGSHYDEQTLAHLGYKVPQGISNEAYFLGSQETPIIITQVVATATTNAKEDGKALAGSSIGDIAGKAYGATDGMQDINFTAPCEGMIMAVFSIEPLADYGSFGMELQNRYKNPFDFWHPELDNLGMQPLPFSTFTVNANSSDPVGWQYRYSELKTKYDIVNESFWDTEKSTWVGIRQNTLTPKQNKDLLHTDTYFFISPFYTNTIFMADFGVFTSLPSDTPYSWTDAYSSLDCYSGDNFLIDADFKLFKTSQMSVYSLPQF